MYTSSYYCECPVCYNDNIEKVYPTFDNKSDFEVSESAFHDKYIWHGCAENAPKGMVYKPAGRFWGRYETDPYATV